MDSIERYMNLFALKKIICFIIFLSLFSLTLLGCAKVPTPQFNSPLQPKSTALPQGKMVAATRLPVHNEGYFTYENGCLFTEIAGERHSLVWWPGLKPIVYEDKGVVEIITPNADPVTVILNEQLVFFGGVPTDRPHDPEFDVIDENAGIVRCPLPYFLIGGPIEPQ